MADPHPIVTYSKAAKFEDVREDLKLVIEGRGLRLGGLQGRAEGRRGAPRRDCARSARTAL